MNKKRKVIIDTDPGIDDLLALAIAGVLEELDVLAFSIVHGNVSLDYTSRNAVLIRDLLGFDIPVYKGSAKPLFYNKKEVSPVHGEDGLGLLYDKYRSKIPETKGITGSLTDLSKLIMESEEKITLVALGPLTNIATLILTNDNLSDKVDEIHIMGGGFTLGNINELTEFNFYSDSHAASIVMNSKIPIVLSPLDLTHQVYFEDDMLEKLPESNDKIKFIKESVEYYAERDPYMHDVCTVLALTHPEFFKREAKDVDIVIGGGIADGQSYFINREAENSTLIVREPNRVEIIEFIIRLLTNNFNN